MTMHLGNVPAGITLYIPFATYGATSGQSITLTGLAVTDIEIYKNGSVTQRASDAGYALLDTDGIDFDGITGIHGFSIDLNDNTDAGFFSVGGQYWVVVSAVTVDSQTVNFIAATFRIVAAEAVTGKPKVDVDAWLGTAAATPTVAGVPEVDLTHIGGDAQSGTDLKDFADAGYDPATNKVEGVKLADVLTTYTGNTPQTGDAFARLGVPAGASASADIAAVKADTAATLLDTGTDGVVIATGAITATTIGSGALTAAKFAAGAVDAAAIATDAGQEIADRLLARNIGGGSDTGRTVTSALRRVRNRVAIGGGTMTVYQEDDLTTDHTAVVTTAAGNPISEVDPA